jgi:glycosyltransferase involved in cell wall biosynthesis
MENVKYHVSVIIPVRNEAAYIQSTLDAVFAQDYPSNFLEVIVADGESDDGTADIIRRYAVNNSQLKWINNHHKTVSFGLNTALSIASGEVIVRMDSHSLYPSNYISTLVKALDEYCCDNVGCLIETIPADGRPASVAIAMALSHPFGVGNAWFRVGTQRVKEVDTVPFGCFRKAVFDKIGMFDVELVRNQDDEFNARMRRHGMKIVLIPFVKVQYVARDSYQKLFKMYYQYGLFKPLVNIKLGQVASVRQLVPLFFVSYVLIFSFFSMIWPILGGGVFGVVLFYWIVSLMVALSVVRWDFCSSKLWHLMWSFFVLHGAYGLGYLKGLILLTSRAGFAKTAKGTTR